MTRTFAALLSAASLAIGAQAAQAKETFVCDVTTYAPVLEQWIPETITVEFGDSRATAKVHDRLIGKRYGGPIDVTVKPRSAATVKLFWTLEDVPRWKNTHRGNVFYEAMFNFKKNKLFMDVLFPGMHGPEPRGIGKCKLTDA